MSAAAPTATEQPAASGPRFARRLLSKPAAVIASAVVAAIVLAVLLAPIIAPYGPNAADLLNPLAGPSGRHLLGTDELGRDILSRLLYGGRSTMLYALEASAVTFAIGLPVGLAAGVWGGRIDRALMSVNDIGMSVPVIVVVLLVLSVFPNDFWVAMVALGIVVSPPLTRNIRGATLSVRHELFVDAARVSGLSRVQIVRRHILPRIAGAVLVQLTLNCALSVLFTVGLGYLGFGTKAPSPSWGSMTAEGGTDLARSPWLLIASGGITGIFVLALGVLGDTIRDTTVERWSEPEAVKASGWRPRWTAVRRGPPAGAGTFGSLAPSALGAPDVARRESPAGPAPEALLSLRDVTVSFPRGGHDVVVADRVSLDVYPGEAIGLVGESGCGKTSVARAVLRLLRAGGRIADGEIWFEGRDVLGLENEDLRRFRGQSVGYISQEPMVALDPSFRVGQIIGEVIRSHLELPRRAVQQRVIELLEQVRLPRPEEVARLYPHELSGGMAQRVSIARALATSPRLLIADEPTTALDVTVQAEILALLKELTSETGMAVLLVSHDWEVVSALCTRALVMYAGQVVEQASLADVLDTPLHPYTQGLLNCRPSLAATGARVLPTIPGSVPAPEQWTTTCRFADRCAYRHDLCLVGPADLVAVEGSSVGHSARCVRVAAVQAEQEVSRA